MDLSPASVGPPRIGAGRALFAATIFIVSVSALANRDLAAIWQPVPRQWPAQGALVWATGLVSAGCGLGLLWRRAVPFAAGILAGAFLVWMLAIKVPVIVRSPTMAAAWESCGETVVLVAAAWALFAELGAGWRGLGLLVGARGLRLARRLYALAMLAFGAAHLAYVKETAALVPAWLPGHVAWVWLTGLAYIAAGVAILTGVFARLAAALSAAQMGAFTLLVWAPVVASGHAAAADWSEAVISWTLTVGGCVIAGAYRDTAWLAVRGRPR
ncbi:MAG TPA: hypothetical protein VGF50_08105 [Caulobacteraceae bacterium]|jgi:uncharacterized membrane protein